MCAIIRSAIKKWEARLSVIPRVYLPVRALMLLTGSGINQGSIP